MSDHSAFQKRYVDPKEQSDVVGLLEHFNLPPKVITFLRTHKRGVQIGLAVIIITVVAVSLYGSYTERRIEESASTLALALKDTGAGQALALQGVVERFDGTPSALWAKVELAHLAIKEKKYADAAIQYSAIHNEVKSDNPLFPLTLFGLAQAEEAEGKVEAAYAAFEQLKGIEGYQLTGYTGMARIHEAKGEYEKALGIYGQYLAVLGDSADVAGERAMVEEKISRIKVRQ